MVCRRRKIKCNREIPCSNCLRSKNIVCEYVNNSPPPPSRREASSISEKTRSSAPEPSANMDASQPRSTLTCNAVHFQTNRKAASPGGILHIPSGPSIADGVYTFTPPTPASQSASSSRDVDLLKFKIKQLEEQLSAATQRATSSIPTTPRWETMTDASQIAGSFHIRREPLLAGLEPTVSRTIMHKTRVFGQSHWMLGVGMVRQLALSWRLSYCTMII